MRIDQATIYKFFFTYEGTELMIPMAGATQEEAVNKLRAFMMGWANELVPVATPTPSPFMGMPSVSQETGPNPFTLQLRIEELVKTLIPLKKPKGSNTLEKLVKDWTGFPMEPENYASIIAELSRMGPEK